MSGSRTRQPFKSDYAQAFGFAALCFAICEWNVVWCCEKIKPGQLNHIVAEELTAGNIAKRFINLVRNMPNCSGRTELAAAASAFAKTVATRNSILHGKPCTGPNGEARLSSSGVMEIPDIEAAADAFSDCSIEVNRLLHGFLTTYVPRIP